MESALLNSLVGLGVGGALAAVVLVWKRQDDQRYAAAMKDIAERSLGAQEKTTVAMQQVAAAIDKLGALQRIEDRMGVLEKAIQSKRRGGEAA